MVKDGAQLYTMEGIAAGLIMLLTTYLVLGSTSVYTPGDTHLTDMQLEQVGSDILKTMDTPTSHASKSSIRTFVENTNGPGFNDTFIGIYLNNPNIMAASTAFGSSRIRIKTTVWFRNQSSNGVESYNLFTSPDDIANTSAETPGVRVSRLVHLDARPAGVDTATENAMRAGPQEVLVEVLMWQV
jgi:hypothetical protein